ncbi:MAG: alpha-galactosidase [Sphaerochaetaceae bacterium]|nr:alpha-galactosidase [Sphaerochaetaceae bacterium]
MDFRLQYRIRNSNTNLITSASNSDVEIHSENDGKWYNMSITAKKDMELNFAVLDHVFTVTDRDLFFMNGYQSWTDSKEMNIGEGASEKDSNKIPRLMRNIYAFDRYGDSVFYDYRKEVVHGYDVFYVKGVKGFFSFNRNFRNAFAIYEVNTEKKTLSIRSDIKGMVLKGGESATVFDLYMDSDVDEGIKAFREYFNCGQKDKIIGYTSWYNHYQNINEKLILNALDNLDDRFDLFQIDDGYETFVGDWMDIDSAKFPNGLNEIVSRIHKNKMKAGIWLAPFVAETKSALFKNHPDWIRKDKNGKPVRCGSNWSGFYALDLRKEEVCSYLKQCFDFFLNLGFDFFKLDFLYASMIEETEGLTRAQMALKSYQYLRDLVGDKIILGCGAAIFPAYEKFDYMRIGPDISLEFDDIWYMQNMHRERISTKITLQNTIYRSLFDGCLFGNDPDVVLLRDNNLKLSKKQREAIIVINSIFGSVFMTSDDIGAYDSEKKALLSLCLDIFKNAKHRHFDRHGNIISICFTYNGKFRNILYDTQKGILS